MVVPVILKLAVSASGAPHSRGAGEVASHSAENFSSNRYEQPILAHCEVSIGDDHQSLSVRGERDHSWGPRPWDMQWTFLAINSINFSLQATVVHIPDWPPIARRYFNTECTTAHSTAVDFDLDFNPHRVDQAVNGRITLTTENGMAVSAEIAAIWGTEIDIPHTVDPPKRTEYRRSLVYCQFQGEYADISSPGWLECNRTPKNNL